MSQFKDIVENIKKISGLQISFLLIFVASSICPGILAVWYFNPELIKEISSFLFLLLAVSITLPIFALNFFVLGDKFINTAPESLSLSEQFYIIISIISLFSMMIVLSPLFVVFIFSLSAKWFVLFLAILRLLILIPHVSEEVVETLRELNKSRTKNKP